MVLPEGADESEGTKGARSKRTKMYSGYCLRPFPAARGNYAVDYSRKTNVKLRKESSFSSSVFFLFKKLRLFMDY